MMVAHTATAFWHHFHPWITKTMDLETVSHFGTQNHRKNTKRYQSGSQEAPRMGPKINKNVQLNLQVPAGRPCGPLDHQNGHSGHQHGTSRSPKQQFGINIFKSHPVISCLLVERGPAAGAKP